MIMSNIPLGSGLSKASRFLFIAERLSKQKVLRLRFSSFERSHNAAPIIIAKAEKMIRTRVFFNGNLSHDDAKIFCQVPLVWIKHLSRKNGSESRNQVFENDFDYDIGQPFDEETNPRTNFFDLSIEERSTIYQNYRKTVEISLRRSVLTPNDVARIAYRLTALNFQCTECREIFDDAFLISLVNFALKCTENLTVRSYGLMVKAVVNLKAHRYPERLNGAGQFQEFQKNIFESIKWYHDSLFIVEKVDTSTEHLRRKFVLAFVDTVAFLVRDLQLDFRLMDRNCAVLIFSRVKQDFDSIFGSDRVTAAFDSKLERITYFNNCSSIILGSDPKLLEECCSIDVKSWARILLWRLANVLEKNLLKNPGYISYAAVNCLCIYLRFENDLSEHDVENFHTFYKTTILPQIKRNLVLIRIEERERLKNEILNRVHLESDDRYKIADSLNNLVRMIESS